MTRSKGIVVFVSIVVFVLIACWLCWLYWRAELKPRRDLDRLLRGDDGIEISSIRISGQGITIELQDQPTTEYLTRAFRRAINEGQGPTRFAGRPYEMWLEFGDGHSVRIAVNAYDDIDGWQILFPIGTMDEANYYWVALASPMPNVLADAIRRMKR